MALARAAESCNRFSKVQAGSDAGEHQNRRYGLSPEGNDERPRDRLALVGIDGAGYRGIVRSGCASAAAIAR